MAREKVPYQVAVSVYYINENFRKLPIIEQCFTKHEPTEQMEIASKMIASIIRRIADRDPHLHINRLLPIPDIKEIRWAVRNTKGKVVRKGETVWVRPDRDPPVSIQTQLLLCVDEALRYYQHRKMETR